MFEEPIRFIADVIRNDRSVLDLLYANHTFVNPVLAKHYGMPDVTVERGTTGCGSTTRGQLRPRRPAADVRVPDQERARPADQPGEARLLGGAPRARRDDSAAARGRAGTAARRGEARTCRCARCWPSIARMPSCAACHARFDSFGLAFEGYGPIGETADQGPRRPAGRHPGRVSRRQRGRRTRGPARLHPRSIAQNDFVDNLCRKLLAYALGPQL